MRKSKIIFIGQSLPLSLGVIDSISSEYEIICIVEFTNIERGSNSLLFNKSQEKKSEYIKFNKSQNQESLISYFKNLNPDLAFICSMPCLLIEKLINIPQFGTINIHPSILPNYKGPNPKFWVYHNLEKNSGITIHYVDKGEDTGNVIVQDVFNIPIGLSSESYDNKVLELATKSSVLAIRKVLGGYKGIEQQKGNYFRARRIKRTENFDYIIDWNITRLYHFICGTNILPEKLQHPRLLSIFFNFRVLKYKQEKTTTRPIGGYYIWNRGIYYQHKEGRLFFTMTLKRINKIFK